MPSLSWMSCWAVTRLLVAVSQSSVVRGGARCRSARLHGRPCPLVSESPLLVQLLEVSPEALPLAWPPRFSEQLLQRLLVLRVCIVCRLVELWF